MAQPCHSLVILTILVLNPFLLQTAEVDDLLKSESVQGEAFLALKASRDEKKFLGSSLATHLTFDIQTADGVLTTKESNQKIQEVGGNSNQKWVACTDSLKTILGHALERIAQITDVHLSTLKHARKLLSESRRNISGVKAQANSQKDNADFKPEIPKYTNGNNDEARWAAKEEKKTYGSGRSDESQRLNRQDEKIENPLADNTKEYMRVIERRLEATEELKTQELQAKNNEDKQVDEGKWEAKEEVQTEGPETKNNEEQQKATEGTQEEKGAKVDGSGSANDDQNGITDGEHLEDNEKVNTAASNVKPDSGATSENSKPDERHNNETWKPNEEKRGEKDEVKTEGWDSKTGSNSNNENWKNNEDRWGVKAEGSEVQGDNNNDSWKQIGNTEVPNEGNDNKKSQPDERNGEVKEDGKTESSSAETGLSNNNSDEKPSEGGWQATQEVTTKEVKVDALDGKTESGSNPENWTANDTKWEASEGNANENSKTNEGSGGASEGNNKENQKPNESQWESKEEVKIDLSKSEPDNNNQNWNSSGTQGEVKDEVRTDRSDSKHESGKSSEDKRDANNDVKTEESPSQNQKKEEEKVEGSDSNRIENWRPDEVKWEGKEKLRNEASDKADMNGQGPIEKKKEKKGNDLNSRPAEVEELSIKEEQKQEKHSAEQHKEASSSEQSNGDSQKKGASTEGTKLQKDAKETDGNTENDHGQLESKNEKSAGGGTTGDTELQGKAEPENNETAKKKDEIKGENMGDVRDLQLHSVDNQNEAVIANMEDSESSADDYRDLIHEFSKLPSKFHETAGHVAQELLPEIHKISQKSKDYFIQANQHIAESFLPLVGKDYAPLVASLISYGLLLLPLAVVIFFFERLRAVLSLQKVLLFANIYLAGYFATLTLASFVLRAEPMSFLQKLSPSSFISLLLLQATAYLLYLFLGILDLVKTCSGGVVFAKFLAVTNCLAGICVGLHYYVTVFHRAMARKSPQTSWKIYGVYGILFLVLCSLARTQRSKKECVRIGDYTTDKKN